MLDNTLPLQRMLESAELHTFTITHINKQKSFEMKHIWFCAVLGAKGRHYTSLSLDSLRFKKKEFKN